MEQLKDAVALLADGMRAAYEKRAAGVSDKDAAAQLGLSVGTYQKRVSRANAAVKAAMAQPATEQTTAPETETPASDAATVRPDDQASVAAAKESAKGDKPKGKPGRKPLVTKFDVDKAVAMYQEGAKVTDIAVAMGYPKGHGQNRVRLALMARGVYGKLLEKK